MNAQAQALAILRNLRPAPDLKELVRNPYASARAWVGDDGRRLVFRRRWAGPKVYLAMVITGGGVTQTLRVPRVKVPVLDDDFEWGDE